MRRIDGAQGEGGGQILRTALALSALTGDPVEFVNVRANRRNPGLAPQHLAGVKAAAQICDAEVSGAALGSQTVAFRPGGPARAGRYAFDISSLAGQGSAGAVTLLLQAVTLPLALAEGDSELVVRGGTHVAWSPPVHYLTWVLLPTLARIGVHAQIALESWGWYPKGGGEIHVTIHGGARLRGVDLTERGALEDVMGLAVATNLPSHIPQRISGRANNLLRDSGLPPRVEPARTSGPSTGAGLFLALAYERVRAGFTALGERGKPSEQVAAEGIVRLLAYHQSAAALDRYLPDQIIPALMLADGPSRLSTVEVTQHTLTSVETTRHFVERRVTVDGDVGEPGVIAVEGQRPVFRAD